MKVFIAFASGLIFGAGLVVSGLINPAKVLGFLDVAGNWDPSLAITMAVAVVVTAAGYRLAFGRGHPMFSGKFELPKSTMIDARLVGGAAVFGVGWGLAGFCPGPALAASALGIAPALIFTAAMLAGMAMARRITSPRRSAISPRPAPGN